MSNRRAISQHSVWKKTKSSKEIKETKVIYERKQKIVSLYNTVTQKELHSDILVLFRAKDVHHFIRGIEKPSKYSKNLILNKNETKYEYPKKGWFDFSDLTFSRGVIDILNGTYNETFDNSKLTNETDTKQVETVMYYMDRLYTKNNDAINQYRDQIFNKAKNLQLAYLWNECKSKVDSNTESMKKLLEFIGIDSNQNLDQKLRSEYKENLEKKWHPLIKAKYIGNETGKFEDLKLDGLEDCMFVRRLFGYNSSFDDKRESHIKSTEKFLNTQLECYNDKLLHMYYTTVKLGTFSTAFKPFLEDVKKDINTFNNLKRQIEAFKNEKETLENDRESLVESYCVVDDINNGLENNLRDKERQIKEYETKIKQLEEGKTTTNGKISQLNELMRLKKMEEKKLVEEKQQLQLTIEKSNAQIANLQSERSAIGKLSSENKNLKNYIQKSKADLEKSKAKALDFEKVTAELKKLQKEWKEKKTEDEKLTADFNKFKEVYQTDFFDPNVKCILGNTEVSDLKLIHFKLLRSRYETKKLEYPKIKICKINKNMFQAIDLINNDSNKSSEWNLNNIMDTEDYTDLPKIVYTIVTSKPKSKHNYYNKMFNLYYAEQYEKLNENEKESINSLRLNIKLVDLKTVCKKDCVKHIYFAALLKTDISGLKPEKFKQLLAYSGHPVPAFVKYLCSHTIPTNTQVNKYTKLLIDSIKYSVDTKTFENQWKVLKKSDKDNNTCKSELHKTSASIKKLESDVSTSTQEKKYIQENIEHEKEKYKKLKESYKKKTLSSMLKCRQRVLKSKIFYKWKNYPVGSLPSSSPPAIHYHYY